MMTRLDTIIARVEIELNTAQSKHPPMISYHEGYAVLLEELDELWEEIKRKKPDKAAISLEAYQLAAMAIRFIFDLDSESL